MAKAGNNSSQRVPWGKGRNYDKEAAEIVEEKIAAGALAIPPNAADIAFQIARIARAADVDHLQAYILHYLAEEWKFYWKWEQKRRSIEQDRRTGSANREGAWVWVVPS